MSQEENKNLEEFFPEEMAKIVSDSKCKTQEKKDVNPQNHTDQSQTSQTNSRENKKNIKLTREEKEEIQIQKEIESLEREDSREIEVLPTFEQFKDSNFGAPTKYNEDMPKLLFEYFMKPRIAKKYRKTTYRGKEIERAFYETEEFPTMEGFCIQQCIGSSSFYNYLRDYPDFLETYELCKKRAKFVLTQNVLDGSWNVRAGAIMAMNYTDMRTDEKKDDQTEMIESVPTRQKGYSIENIDTYCKEDPIEAEFNEIKNN